MPVDTSTVILLPGHPASFAHNFLFLRVPGCNSIADLSLKIVVWTHKFAVGTHARIQEFSSGGSRSVCQKKALTTFFFFFFFLVLSLFYRSQMVNFKEIYHFSSFQRGSNIFQGEGPTFSRVGGGSNCLFPIQTTITCDFPGGGGVRTPCHPLWIRTWDWLILETASPRTHKPQIVNESLIYCLHSGHQKLIKKSIVSK